MMAATWPRADDVVGGGDMRGSISVNASSKLLTSSSPVHRKGQAEEGEEERGDVQK
jgi:hypothetical protein